LKSVGVRVQVDRGRGSFGRRLTDWELKGVPLRVEVGPRDLVQGLATLVRRDNSEKMPVALDALGARASEVLEQMQTDMFEGSRARRDANTHDVRSVDEAIEAAQTGFARLAWDVVDGEGEQKLKAEAITVRCLIRPDGSMPASDIEDGLVCIVAKSY
jgi:prolyl-tRNA synthetase